MPTRARYAKQKFNRELSNAEPGDVIRFPGSDKEFTIVRRMPEETPEQKAERFESETRERERARAYETAYAKSPAGKARQAVKDKRPARKAKRTAKDKARAERAREQAQLAPFWGVDTEGVNMWDLAWVETVDYIAPKLQKPVLEIGARVASRSFGEGVLMSFKKEAGTAFVKYNDGFTREIFVTALAIVAPHDGMSERAPPVSGPTRRLLSEVSEAEKRAIVEAGGAIYVPQKIIMLAAGNDDGERILCCADPDLIKQGMLGKDAPALSSVEMMKMLCSLPDEAPADTHFVWYAGGYDATHILKDLPFELGWEIARQMSFDNRGLVEPGAGQDLDEEEYNELSPDEPSIRRPVIWITTDPVTGKKIGFGIRYLKSKWLKLGMLRYPEDPKKWWKKRGGLDYSKSINIEDVIGFFQSSFLTAMEGMASSIVISKKEQASIDWGKPLRGDFSNQKMKEIIPYNHNEIIILARMMEAFRKAVNELGLYPTKFHGPGVLAEEKLGLEGITPTKEKDERKKTFEGRVEEWKAKGKEGDEPQRARGAVDWRHYPEFLRAGKASNAQDWSHHAFSGGRIELIRPGVHCDPRNPIFEYDVCSAYPAIIADLPSMRSETEKELERRFEKWEEGGRRGETPKKQRAKYKHHKAENLSLEEFKALIARMNMLSMCEVAWMFNLEATRKQISDDELRAICIDVDQSLSRNEQSKEIDRRVREAEGLSIPFSPLFYRCNGEPENPRANMKGTILYPSEGRGRYYRDELLAAIAWCEKFPEAVVFFRFEGAMEFRPYLKDLDGPSSYDRPFGFVRDLFDERSRIVAETRKQVKEWQKQYGEPYMSPKPDDPKVLKKWLEELDKIAELHGGPKPYNILEKAIKLILNSLYGKTAQSIGNVGEIPKASNPFYAGAITAGTRAQLLRAALHNPHGVVFFATDGIKSIGALEGLETVKEKVLGEWEFEGMLDTQEAAVFVHPGIYTFYDCKGEAKTKTRGFKIDLARDFMMHDIVKAWKEGDKAYLVHSNGKRELIPKQMVPGVKEHLELGNEARRVLKSERGISAARKKELKMKAAYKGTLVYENKIAMETTSFITLGMAISSEDNWQKCGSWRTQNRDMDLQKSGTKRMLCYDKRRAERLVFVEPADNYELNQLSCPYYPDWLDDDGLGEHEDENEINMKFGEVGEEIY